MSSQENLIVKPHELVGRNGGSFQECEVVINASLASAIGLGVLGGLNTKSAYRITRRIKRYCTIRDNEYAPPTSASGRVWVQIYRTPDNQE